MSVHVAVATQVELMLAKPGMGVDEAYSLIANEQSRLMAVLRRRARSELRSPNRMRSPV
jgi:methylaspartate ammonia-lyase